MCADNAHLRLPGTIHIWGQRKLLIATFPFMFLTLLGCRHQQFLGGSAGSHFPANAATIHCARQLRLLRWALLGSAVVDIHVHVRDQAKVSRGAGLRLCCADDCACEVSVDQDVAMVGQQGRLPNERRCGGRIVSLRALNWINAFWGKLCLLLVRAEKSIAAGLVLSFSKVEGLVRYATLQFGTPYNHATRIIITFFCGTCGTCGSGRSRLSATHD